LRWTEHCLKDDVTVVLGYHQKTPTLLPKCLACGPAHLEWTENLDRDYGYSDYQYWNVVKYVAMSKSPLYPRHLRKHPSWLACCAYGVLIDRMMVECFVVVCWEIWAGYLVTEGYWSVFGLAVHIEVIFDGAV